ncbi:MULTISPECIES: TetR/AcrR family transcriptional regulator [Oceanotoga]|jgi:AcrR family transcriptional regulator|uniref:TetR/AcrR family transcriptional regulator n=1 Tax=Oceanotoga TaxID=1255275 RepID=UPI00264BD0F0|nr:MULTISPECIES: TetR/AcrR family transcriptional regulator [Oceanotoga]MDN5341492.1 hypothetical protein [Oceanotoga sp.]MDO7977660.1 TetR/AcrR family transcriptional regulator [Oceanotoga teriensis]
MKKHYSKKSTEKKIEKLYNFSRSELIENGIQKYNFEKVIKYAGLSKATVYKKFKNRKNFIIETIKFLIDDYIEPFKKLLDDVESFDEVFDFLYGLNIDFKEILDIYPIEDLFSDFEILDFINNYYYEKFGIIIKNKIEEFKIKGEIRNDIKTDFIFEYITSVTKSIGNLLSKYEYKEVIESFSVLINSSLKNDF